MQLARDELAVKPLVVAEPAGGLVAAVDEALRRRYGVAREQATSPGIVAAWSLNFN